MENAVKTQEENEARVAEEYLSSLSDLNCNSKPLINMLTMLAEENIEYAPVIVKVVEQHIAKVHPEFKLPILYLIDSIVKNVKSTYVTLFSQCVVNIFCGVFEQVNEKVRERMYALRQTWNEVFAAQKMYALDVRVKQMDHNWPITAKQPQPSIHVNPNFLKPVNPAQPRSTDMEEILHAKTRELLELKKRKLELELEATKKHLEEQEKQLSKTTDSVIPLDTVGASQILSEVQPQQIPIQTPSGIINSQSLPSHQMHTTVSMPNVYEQHSFRNIRPPSHSNIGVTQGYPHINNLGKGKVHPVNPALLTTVRQRDPRLARHHHSQLHINENYHKNQDSSLRNSSTVPQNLKNDEKQLSHNSGFKSSRMNDNSKSVGRSSATHSSSRISGNLGTSTSEIDKDRKRSENSATSSPGESGSSTERRRKSSIREKLDSAAKCDKDAFEIAPLSVTSKRKSSSPGSSPHKSKELKRSNRSRNHNRSKHRSPSRSPKSIFFNDVDLRSRTTSPEKRIKFSDKAKEDYKSSHDTKDLDKTSSAAKNNDVSKVDIFNTRNENGDGKRQSKQSEINSDNDDSKKRPPATTEEGAPTAKKSRSTKLDTLFGTEDVDLRQVISNPQKQISSDPTTPPPPPMISDKETVKNWDSIKTTKFTVSFTDKTIFKKSSLDDVRAKLAKAARNSRFDKFEKTNKDLSQRFKLDELNMNEDSQEANDEKIRTIITQAQELLESNSISQEQYKNLVQTVMSINETNKLKEAKRRELLSISQLKQAEDEDDKLDIDRSAARDAVLKKRIPKLTKEQIAANEGKLQEKDKNVNVGDKNDANDTQSFHKLNFGKNKRSKPSKWGEKVDLSMNVGPAVQTVTPSQRPWTLGPGNKRPGFRNNAVQSQAPLVPKLNRPIHMPWQVGSGISSNAFIAPAPTLTLPSGNISNSPAQGPSLTPKPCNSIDNPQSDLVRTITIDGMAKEIRIYDQVAIVFMELDQPREIGFQPGRRSITIDTQEPIVLKFNDDYKPITIDGETHRIRFGFPSHELYIDEDWYEVYFGGPPVSIPIKNKLHMLKAEGPPPQVNIGLLRRDLVVGKINMIIDAHLIIPLFLDAKLQIFRIGKDEHSIQFADNLQTVLLNNESIPVEYGGLPRSLLINGKKYFVRFSALPNGVIPGEVHIKDMVRIKTDLVQNIQKSVTEVTSPAIGAPEASSMATISENQRDKSEDNTQQQKIGGKMPNLNTMSASTSALTNTALNNINIDELFQKLVSSGILGVNTTANTKSVSIDNNEEQETEKSVQKTSTEEIVQETIIPIDLSKPDSIKTRQPAIIATLYSGMQCSSCGVRFPPEQTIKYSQHLDWHFRQNRRERDSSRKAHSRKWYYDINDWIQYEEIEDMEEREKTFFETQQNEMEANDESSNHQLAHSPVPSCAAGPNDVDRNCDMCHEKFEQFYNEELEEWHLRSAIRIEDKIYHPLCYEDYKASLNSTTKHSKEKTHKVESELFKENDDNAIDIDIKPGMDQKEDGQGVLDDDDDDVIVLPNEEPSITEIDDDDEEYVPKNVTVYEMKGNDNEEKQEDDNGNENAGSDVEIQEPHIPFTDLDTYVEKQLPETEEDSQFSFANTKVKEEPKDDEDDDGFEDVGTFLIAPEEEISLNSSEDTQSHMLAASGQPSSPIVEPPPSTESTTELGASVDNFIDTTASMDGNLDPENEHNLSTAGPAPAVPLSTLVNKIKINITKNISSTSTNSVTSSLVPATSTSNSSNSDNLNKSSINHPVNSSIATVSTIPVLCGGETINTFSSVTPSISATSSDGFPNNVSIVNSIPVIGSYGTSSSTSRYKMHIATTKQPTPPIEESITYELKPSLQKVILKKTKKVECGIETSGLCSIM